MEKTINMIIIKLLGGLGNQLFQYALGRNIAQKNKTQLKLDITPFETYSKHRYSLNHFNILENFATREEINGFKKFDDNNIINNLIRTIEKIKPFKIRTHIKENNYYTFDPKILTLGDNVYLDGFWQNEKYFKGIKDVLHDEFTLKEKLEKNLLEVIMKTNSVSIHVRRADYVTNPNANKIYGVCSLDYYNKAIATITDLVTAPHFFVFSDDLGWCKKNIRLNFPTTFIDNGADKNYEDLILMSRCKHNIIANSSFSWWGAWLNNNVDKIVIAPKQWLNNSIKGTKEMVLESWIKI